MGQPLHYETFDLSSLFHRTAEGLQPQADAKSISLTLEGPAEVFVEGDEHLLERALENLLGNALRYTPKGGKIEAQWRLEQTKAVFTVADTGPGIAPGDLPNLFKPLYRGEPSRNPETGGVGLGLTIARRILKAHGGDLTAANYPEGGAQFIGWVSTSQAH